MTMPTDYRLPALPLGDSQVKIARWLKQPGDPLEPGDPLLVVVNDRVEVALPSPGAGILDAVLVAEGAMAQVGAVIARIAPGSAAATTAAPAARAAAGPGRASPVAARIAAAANIDIETLSGSGPRGRILKRDVLAALDDRPPTLRLRSGLAADRRPPTGEGERGRGGEGEKVQSPSSNLQAPISESLLLRLTSGSASAWASSSSQRR
jgi:pyruvate/2-oxoglutarate dehydrogenase complex dihydrolipoamide acyltransferase (E2) component